MKPEPKTLQEAIVYFADPDNCLNFLVARRFHDGVVCPRCASKDVRFLATRRIWECKAKHAKRQFSIKVNTIFEDSPISLDKWLIAVWMIANCKNGVSSYEIARDLQITQKSAWFMMHRIRKALAVGSFNKLGGEGSEVETDETVVGGKLKNMHRGRKIEFFGSGGALRNKAIVMGALDRTAKQVRAEVIPYARRENMEAMVRKNVKFGSTVYTDNHIGYTGLRSRYSHGIINHMEKYVEGRVHTNGIENFWSLLKRGLGGTYISVEPFHLHRYVDEQAFRFNNRATPDNPLNDADRFSLAVSNIVGKRLTYAELTAKGAGWKF